MVLSMNTVFIETPYRVVKDGVATEEIRYLSADDEERMTLLRPTNLLMKMVDLLTKKVASRGLQGEIDLVNRDKITWTYLQNR